MAPSDRRQRERERLRSAILQAAREIASEEGWSAVSVRKIADRIEYTAGTLYEHFDSKDAILEELLRGGFHALGEQLREAREANTADPVGAMVDAAWRFSRSRPELYQVMHGLDGVPFGIASAPIEAKSVFDQVKEVLRNACPAAGDADLEDATDAVWAAVHGFITLEMTGRIAGGRPRAVRLSKRAVADLVAAFNQRPCG